MKYYIFGNTQMDAGRSNLDIMLITTSKKEADEYRKIFETFESSYESGIYEEYEYHISFKKSLREAKKLQKDLEEIWK